MNLQVSLYGDNCWPGLKDRPFTEGTLTGIARLPAGMGSGRSTVTVRIELPDGQTVLAQTSLALLSNAVLAFNTAEATGQ